MKLTGCFLDEDLALLLNSIAGSVVYTYTSVPNFIYGAGLFGGISMEHPDTTATIFLRAHDLSSYVGCSYLVVTPSLLPFNLPFLICTPSCSLPVTPSSQGHLIP
ncbi:hypothetical protein D9758_014956 [Tetrapyrgos nigripes]|uniref:Uncharacterized protein n=1 Tax=Tetrapyrgos nigripes TaxID=182062 RepID=A0A8H5CJL6_9AGAR|nr:hypothetical protein D9758_014956 [Tetrapyrgos nigripes]